MVILPYYGLTNNKKIGVIKFWGYLQFAKLPNRTPRQFFILYGILVERYKTVSHMDVLNIFYITVY